MSAIPASIQHEGLLQALSALDTLLNRALQLAPEVYGWEPGSTQFRGLYIAEKDVRFALDRRPGAPVFEHAGNERYELIYGLPALGAIGARYGLDEFEAAVLLIALAPEIDLRYERAYAYLQDDVGCRRPSVDLILNLLCGNAEEKLERCACFSSDATLVTQRLIRVFNERNHVNSPLLAYSVALDEQIIRELMGGSGRDSRLARFAERIDRSASLDSLSLPEGHAEGLRRLWTAARREGKTLALWFRGVPAGLKRRTAEALASETGRPLLVVSAARAAEAGAAAREYMQIAVREAALTNAFLFLDAQNIGDTLLWNALADGTAAQPVDTIVSTANGNPELDGLDMVEVSFPIPPFAARRECWIASLEACGSAIDETELDSIASRFRLYPDQIGHAVAAARSAAAWNGAESIDAPSLYAAARTQCGRQLGALARKIDPRHGWDDIVLPPITVNQLRAMCARVSFQHRVLEDWGFDARLSTGKGVTALFAGPSGVGKTMAAEIIARELKLDLYKIDLSSVVSKYIGETEKNLERIFNAAENAGAILFFDEADSLFGKRSEVRDSHDRYANLEISYLLQKMEMYEGVAILASNLRQNLDESFVRRLAFSVHFPFPDEERRRRIWRAIWPLQVPLDPALDFDFLASQFKLSGGNIRNVALAAAFAAAEEASDIRMRHIAVALEREYQKMSKPLSKEQFGQYAAEVNW
jgi:AAA+ superfamily predicted ATPase